MQCLKFRSQIFPTPAFSRSFSPYAAPLSAKPHSSSSSSLRMSTSAAVSVIEHVVLFKVKADTDPSKVQAMVSGLNGLISLDRVLHLTAGPVLRTGSSLFSFTHLLHSRYSSKDDLAAYSAHPDHLRVVKESVLPICEDIMAVDWVADGFDSAAALAPGSALRVSFLKLKENLGDEAKEEVLGVIKGLKSRFGRIEQITVGENFSPARAKGFSIASLAVFKTTAELAAVDSDKELVDEQKDKVRGYLDGVIAVDYVVGSAQSANL